MTNIKWSHTITILNPRQRISLASFMISASQFNGTISLRCHGGAGDKNSYPITTVYINAERNIQSGGITFHCVDIRLMRRIVRDFYRRSASPELTFKLWNTVRQNENENIFPHAVDARIKINSTLCYEIGMLKPYLEEILPLVPDTSEYYDRAQEILGKIADFSPIDKRYLSEDSLYHEFV